jgi:hypothetical protein
MSRKIDCNKVSIENINPKVFYRTMQDDETSMPEESIEEVEDSELVVHRNEISFLLDHVKMIEAPTDTESVVFEKLGLRGVTFVTDRENNRFVVEYSYKKFNKMWEEFLNLDRLGI